MADIQITKIIVLRGEAADLPHKLDSGELAFATDEGRLFIGCDPTTGTPQFARSDFPFRNIEILTENSSDLFAKMHGDRMKNGGGLDYYDALLGSDTNSWSAVQVDRDGELKDYRIADVASVSAFIDYAVTDTDGVPMRVGSMHLSHCVEFEGEPYLTDNSMTRRDMTLVDGANYDAVQVYGLVAFRFKVQGPVNAPYLTFQFKNLAPTDSHLRFKVSRPNTSLVDVGTLPTD